MGQAGAKVTSVTGSKSLILFSGRKERYLDEAREA